MWCKWCGQDVPAIGSQAASGPHCARCGHPLATGEAASTSETDCGIDLGRPRPAPAASTYDDWELNERIRHLQAKTGTWRRYDPLRSDPPRRAYAAPSRGRRAVPVAPHRIHPPHARMPARHRARSRSPRRSSLLAWTMLSLGLMAFACGTALLVWSSVEKRAELWNLGLPVAIGGQVGLLLGLILQLERIWQNSRDASRKLDNVGAHLHELERATTMLHVPHATAAQAYYAHVADRADPRILISDLQGQLDLLAEQLARGA
jgi:hypothetical protein